MVGAHAWPLPPSQFANECFPKMEVPVWESTESGLQSTSITLGSVLGSPHLWKVQKLFLPPLRRKAGVMKQKQTNVKCLAALGKAWALYTDIAKVYFQI